MKRDMIALIKLANELCHSTQVDIQKSKLLIDNSNQRMLLSQEHNITLLKIHKQAASCLIKNRKFGGLL